MTVAERISAVRKHTGLSQTEFGARMGTTINVVKSLEYGVTEVSGPMMRAVCMEYGIRLAWLECGEGEMREDVADALVGQLAKHYGLNDFDRRCIDAFIRLPKAAREALRGYIADAASGMNAGLPSTAADIDNLGQGG